MSALGSSVISRSSIQIKVRVMLMSLQISRARSLLPKLLLDAQLHQPLRRALLGLVSIDNCIPKLLSLNPYSNVSRIPQRLLYRYLMLYHLSSLLLLYPPSLHRETGLRSFLSLRGVRQRRSMFLLRLQCIRDNPLHLHSCPTSQRQSASL